MAQVEERDVEVGRFDAGRDQIVVRVHEYKGKAYLDVRRYWEDDDGDWHPGRKGCSIPASIAGEVVAAMAAGVTQVEAAASLLDRSP